MEKNMSSELLRFGISIGKDLIGKFDKKIKGQGYENRSEAIRDLIRKSFIEEAWEENAIVAGGISIVYDHHHRDLLSKVMDIQHDYHDLIISTQHVHLSHTGCLEVLIVKGKTEEIKELYGRLKSIKGIDHIGITRTGVT
jgi:CopG family transcriptional regulator, nickel-responsive regulator